MGDRTQFGMSAPVVTYTASRSSLAGRKAILLALILMASPVAGFQPIPAARFRIRRMPRPVRRISLPLLRCRVASATKIAQDGLRVLRGEVVTVGQRFGQLLERHGGLHRSLRRGGRFLGCGAAFFAGGMTLSLR